MTTPTTTVPFRRSTTILTLVVPVAVLAGATLVAASWADDLPDPVAVHWGAHGPDGFGGLTSAILPMVVVGLLTSVGFWALSFWAGRSAATRRIAAGTSVGLAVFLGGILLGGLAGQRGLADAHDAPGLATTILVAALAGVVCGALAAAVSPGDPERPATAPIDPHAPRLALSGSERAVWQRTATSRSMVVVAAVAAVTVLAVTVVTRVWALGLLTVAIVALIATMAVFDVTVDDRGLVAKGLLGWPRLEVPLDEVVAARATTVVPVRDYGGWGYRVGRGGRIGVVLRKGEALEVRRTGERVAVVTVDDAATAAALLNTLADRARA